MDQQNQETVPVPGVLDGTPIVTQSPDPALVAHVAAEVQAQSAAAGAGLTLSGAGNTIGTSPIDPAEFEAARQKAQAEHAAYERKQHRLQISALILAGREGNGNVAVDADRAVAAADALLDRLSRD